MPLSCPPGDVSEASSLRPPVAVKLAEIRALARQEMTGNRVRMSIGCKKMRGFRGRIAHEFHGLSEETGPRAGRGPLIVLYFQRLNLCNVQ